MEVFLKEASFHGVMLDELYLSSPKLTKTLHDIMTEGIAAGAVRPLPRTVFATSEVEQAFRYSCHDGDKLVREL
jgi:fatty acid synthase